MCIRDRHNAADVILAIVLAQGFVVPRDAFLYIPSVQSWLLHNLVAVSYTHLDVYKRQDMDCLMRLRIRKSMMGKLRARLEKVETARIIE